VRQVDTNADGNIDFEEFREVMRKFAEESKLSQEEV
jgi:Ca2+-binding EF-hand superfamily protein